MGLIAALAKMPGNQAVYVGLAGSGIVAFFLSSIQHAGGKIPCPLCTARRATTII
jgi:disulfide bond formation protein DsbB